MDNVTPMRGARPPARRRGRPVIIIVAVLVGLLLLFGGRLLGLYVDWLWFGEVDLRPVFWTSIWSRLVLGLAGGALFFAIVYLNVELARRLAPTFRTNATGDVIEPKSEPLRRHAGALGLAVSLLVAAAAGVARLLGLAHLPEGAQGDRVRRRRPDLRPRPRLLRLLGPSLARRAGLRPVRAARRSRPLRAHAPRPGRHRVPGEGAGRRRVAAGDPDQTRRLRPLADRRGPRRSRDRTSVGDPRGDLRRPRPGPAVPRLGSAVLDRRRDLRRRLHRRRRAPSLDTRDDGPRLRHRGGADLERLAPPPVVAGRDRRLGRRPRRPPRHRARSRPVADRQSEPAVQGARVHRPQPRLDQGRLPARARGGQAPGDEDEGHAGGVARQRDHPAQRAPLGSRHPGRELPPASAAPPVLLVRRRRRRPLHHQGRLHPDHGLGARAQHRRSARAGADVGQPAHHLHARLRRRHVGGEPGDQRRLSGLPRPGRAAAVYRRPRDRPAAHLLRRGRHRLHARQDRASASSTTPARRATSSRSTRAPAASRSAAFSPSWPSPGASAPSSSSPRRRSTRTAGSSSATTSPTGSRRRPRSWPSTRTRTW